MAHAINLLTALPLLRLGGGRAASLASWSKNGGSWSFCLVPLASLLVLVLRRQNGLCPRSRVPPLTSLACDSGLVLTPL